MNVLDENIPESQCQLLQSWRIHVKRIGQEVGHQGMKDREDIVPLLHELRQAVLFTRDLGFYDRKLCHRRYGIVCLAVGVNETARYVRDVLHHPTLDTKAKRMGRVVHVSKTGIRFWRLGEEEETKVNWDE